MTQRDMFYKSGADAMLILSVIVGYVALFAEHVLFGLVCFVLAAAAQKCSRYYGHEDCDHGA